MSKELKFVMLLDCYGELLTPKQREYMELYYCEDLSFSEISEPNKITRQAVRDVIKRSELILLDYESKLGFASRLKKLYECFDNLKIIAQDIKDINTLDAINNCIDKGLNLI